MKDVIIQNGSKFNLTELDGMHEKLPVGIYSLEFNRLTGYYFQKQPDLQLPTKIYGDTKVADRWLTTYHDRERNLGILLSGQKGSGKTLLAKYTALKSGLPIIMVNDSFPDCPPITPILTDPILGDCVLFFDEFEKHFNEENSEILGLLDGPQHSHHLCILTINDINKVNPLLLNRPSRIFYQKVYDGLDDEVLTQLCEDSLINKDFTADFLKTCGKIFDLSFDIAYAIIHDMNLFNEPASKCIKYLGITRTVTSLAIYQRVNNKDDYSLYYDDEYVDEDTSEVEVRVGDYTYVDDIGKPIATTEIKVPLDDSLEKLSKNTYKYVTMVTFYDLAKYNKEVLLPRDIRLPSYHWHSYLADEPESVKKKYANEREITCIIKFNQFKRYTY